MSYILFVNPNVLGAAGMNQGAVFTATALSAAFGTLMMGLYARYPIATAPALGINAFFSYSVVIGMGVNWQTDRKSTRLNSSHVSISYAVFCLKKKKNELLNY